MVIVLPPKSPPNGVIVGPGTVGPGTLDPDAFASDIFDINLSSPLPRGSFTAEICLTITRDLQKKDLCLGYFDVEKRKWVCEDPCLDRKSTRGRDQFCGTTDHFTNFAILLMGSNGVDGDPCGSAGNNYITGTWQGDLGLVGSFTFLVLASCFILVVLSFVPRFRIFFFGRENMRVITMRRMSKDFM